MNIAIIGAGNVGGTLGTRWAQGGHQVVFGSRKPDDPKLRKVLDAAGPNARVATIAEAAKSADVVGFTTPWEATEEAVSSAGNLAGKIVFDATNPLYPGMEGLKRGLAVGHDTSAAEQVAAWAKGARVVKAFNTTGWPNMADTKLGGQAATMFICGDDPDAKTAIKKLSDELGFETVDAGALTSARYLEPMAMLWINLAFNTGMGVNFAFKIIKR